MLEMLLLILCVLVILLVLACVFNLWVQRIIEYVILICLNFQIGFGSDCFEPINGYNMRILNIMIMKGIDAQIRLPGYYEV